VNLWKSVKAAGMGIPHVIVLLKVANNDLPAVELRYERLKREVDDLEANKHNSARILQELSDQISTMGKTLNQYLLSCKERRLKLTKDGYSCKR
jgi:wobble nucleotide-excising tRNase